MKITSILLLSASLSVSILLSGCFHYKSVDNNPPSSTVVSQRTTRTPAAATTTTVTRETN